MAFRKIEAGLVHADVDQFIGKTGTIFYDNSLGDFRISDGQTPGGIALSFGGGGGGGDYTLPTASTTVKGGVKIDGSTITIANQVISVGTVPYSKLSGTPTIPTNNNQLTNGAAYITSAALSGLATETYVTTRGYLTTVAYADVTGKPTLFSGSYADLTNKPTLFSGSYADLTNKPTIPTNTNELTNGAGYITSSSLTGLATETYVTTRGYITSAALSGYALTGAIPTDISQLTDTTNLLGTGGGGGGGTTYITNTVENPFSFSIAGDDSTLREIASGESIKFTGAGGVAVTTDAEGAITITQGTTSSLVNSTKTVSLGSDGALTLPEGGRINAVGYNNIVRLGNDGFMVANGSIFNENETGLSINGQNSDAGTYIQIPGRTSSENGEPLIISHNWDAAINIQGGGGIWSFGFDGSLTIPGKIRVVEYLTRSNLTAYDQTSGYGGAGGPNAFSILESDWPTANIDIPVGAEITSPTFNTATVTSPVIQGPTSTWIIPIGTDNATAFTSTVDITYISSKTWTFGNDGSLTFPNGTVQTTAPESFSFSVAGDDSTQRAISNNELIKFIGAGGITTASDAEGNITITGPSLTGLATETYVTTRGYITSSALTGLATESYVTSRGYITGLSYNDLTDKPNLAGTYSWSIAADDSTQLEISAGNLVKIVGTRGVTTTSNADGQITITGPDLSTYATQSYVNVALSSAGITISATVPVGLSDGALWYNSSNLELYVRYDNAWVAASSSSSADTDYNDLINKPTNVSQFANDADYVSRDEVYAMILELTS